MRFIQKNEMGGWLLSCTKHGTNSRTLRLKTQVDGVYRVVDSCDRCNDEVVKNPPTRLSSWEQLIKEMQSNALLGLPNPSQIYVSPYNYQQLVNGLSSLRYTSSSAQQKQFNTQQSGFTYNSQFGSVQIFPDPNR